MSESQETGRERLVETVRQTPFAGEESVMRLPAPSRLSVSSELRTSEVGPILYFYVLAAGLLRILPHPWNLTPVGAMFLFSAATFRSRLEGWLVPLAALMITDYAVLQILYHGQYAWFSPLIWTSFSLVGIVGWTLRRKTSVARVAGAALGGSLVFFIASNFAVWVGGEGRLYPMTLSGLVICYTAALPFFRNEVAGNLVYCAAMFGSYHWVAARWPGFMRRDTTVTERA
jgi:hypothetical protein